MNRSPQYIDNAKVLEWAWSGDVPFGVINYDNGEIAATIYGLAICQYENSNKVYRFSCDKNWETEQDFDYDSVSEAKKELPQQYKQVEAMWQACDQNT